QPATRVRWNMNTDTPLPPDVAAGENPPDGAIIDYYLPASSTGPITLEIRDESGNLVRIYSSADPMPASDPTLAIPRYWVRPPRMLSADAGAHRFLWDMRYAPVPGVRPSYPISAVYKNTAPEATSPWAMPGKYTATLTVKGEHYTQPLTVRMDTRVKTSQADLATQFRLSKQLYDSWITLSKITDQSRAVRTQLTELRSKAATDEIKKPLEELDQKLQIL